MKDVAKGRGGDNNDKSLQGLLVALAMAVIIAGSAILFAYAASSVSVFDWAAGTTVAGGPDSARART